MVLTVFTGVLLFFGSSALPRLPARLSRMIARLSSLDAAVSVELAKKRATTVCSRVWLGARDGGSGVGWAENGNCVGLMV